MTEENVQRKLTAIMFTDIVGYSKMMGSDEVGTLAFLKFHNALVREEIEKNEGHVIKTVGDAFLADFDSAVNAVRCAVSIQKRFFQYNQDTGMTQKVRIGIHIGDVVIKNHDIFGDGVNIAARIQPIAEPGGICISQDVYNQIKNKVEFETVSLGPKELKNIAEKVSIYKIVTEVLGNTPAPKKSSSMVPLVVAALALLAALGWYFYGQQNNKGQPPAAIAPIVTVAAPAPSATPVPAPKPMEAKPAHKAKKKSASSKRVHVFYSGLGQVYTYGSSDIATANNKVETGNGGTMTYHYDTGTDWGCGITMPPERGPYVGNLCADLSAYSCLRITALVPAGLKFTIKVQEAGCDKMGLPAYQGVNGADGEEYVSEGLVGTGDWHNYEFKLSELKQFPYFGNQNGNKVLDKQAIRTVDLTPDGSQGAGIILLKKVEFFNP